VPHRCGVRTSGHKINQQPPIHGGTHAMAIWIAASLDVALIITPDWPEPETFASPPLVLELGRQITGGSKNIEGGPPGAALNFDFAVSLSRRRLPARSG
jgi:hypothetical protein